MKAIIQQLKKESGRKRVFTVLLCAITLSFVMYGFAIASTTILIADANTHNKDINEIQTEIAELEVEYFEMINTFSVEEAKIYGFSELTNVHYAVIDQTKSVAYNI